MNKLTWDTTGDYWGTGYLIDRRQARELDPETPGNELKRNSLAAHMIPNSLVQLRTSSPAAAAACGWWQQ